MVTTASLRLPQTASIKRLPWMRRIQLYSPKAARMLVLFSYDAVSTWALAESSPLVEAFCEYPGFVPLDGARTLADFWVRRAGREQFIKIEGGIDLSLEFAERVKTYAGAEISLVCGLARAAPSVDRQLAADQSILRCQRALRVVCNLGQGGRVVRRASTAFRCRTCPA